MPNFHMKTTNEAKKKGYRGLFFLTTGNNLLFSTWNQIHLVNI